MEFKAVILFILVASVYSAPQTEGEEKQAVAPPPRPIANAIANTLTNINTALVSANKLVTSAIESLRNSSMTAAGDAASTTNKFITDSAEMVSNRIQTIAQTLSDNIKTMTNQAAVADAAASKSSLYPSLPIEYEEIEKNWNLNQKIMLKLFIGIWFHGVFKEIQ